MAIARPAASSPGTEIRRSAGSCQRPERTVNNNPRPAAISAIHSFAAIGSGGPIARKNQFMRWNLMPNGSRGRRRCWPLGSRSSPVQSTTPGRSAPCPRRPGMDAGLCGPRAVGCNPIKTKHNVELTCGRDPCACKGRDRQVQFCVRPRPQSTPRLRAFVPQAPG
jgi:hypothetical protein